MKLTRKDTRQGKKQLVRNAASMAVEGLEDRRLLTAWSRQDLATGLDKATANYPSITGAGETVVVIDSGGIDTSHPALAGRIVATWNFDNNSPDVFPYDNNAHPTGVAGEIAGDPHYVNGQLYQGVAPGVNIIQLRASGSWNDQQAFDWVIAHKSQYNIVGVNWTDLTGGSTAPFVGELQTLKNMGVFVGTPTGNYNGIAPAINNHLWFQTGSTTVWGSLASDSPSGPNIDMFAPGDITIVWYWSGTHIDYPSQGTSWTSPQTVGTAALIKQVNPNFTPDQIMQIMRDSADWSQGYPQLKVDAAIALAFQRSGQGVPSAPSVPTPTPTPSQTPTPTSTGGVPNGPFSLSAAASGSSVALSFYDNSSNETGFVIERAGTDGVYSKVTTLGAASGTKTQVNYTDSTVSAGTSYAYRAYAVNGSYASGMTTATVTTAGAAAPTPTPTPAPTPTPTPTTTGTNPGGVPNGPFSMTATPNGTSVGLSFYDNSGNETGFVIERAGTDGVYSKVATLAAAAGTWTVVNYTDSTVSAGTSYAYRAYAINGPYVSAVTTATVTTPGAASPTPTPTSTATTPFQGTAFSTGSQIEAEWYDNGGANVAYHTVQNYNESGHTYRGTDTVDVAWSGSEGSNVVGWTHAGEWLKYSLNVAAAGTYQVQARVASLGNGGTFHVEVDGVNVSGTMTIPNTGAWDTYTTVTANGVSLSAGNHVVRLVMDGNGSTGNTGNFDWIKFVPTGSTPVTTPTPTPTSTPIYTPNTWAVPNGPYGLFTSAASGSTLAVNFYDNSDNESAYVIERASWSGGPYSTVATVNVDAATSAGKGLRSWTDTGLSAGTTYYYRVTAINQIGASSSTMGSGTTR